MDAVDAEGDAATRDSVTNGVSLVDGECELSKGEEVTLSLRRGGIGNRNWFGGEGLGGKSDGVGNKLMYGNSSSLKTTLRAT